MTREELLNDLRKTIPNFTEEDFNSVIRSMRTNSLKRKWVATHRDEMRGYKQKYVDNNKDKVHSVVQRCRKKYRDKYLNSMRITKRMQTAEKLQVIQEYKIEKGCDICGYKKCARSLDFHHAVNGKKAKRFEVSRMIYANLDIDDILGEARKCRVLCKNCHTELHDEAGRSMAQPIKVENTALCAGIGGSDV